jgi:exodeoxyribonuclease VII large subunit
MDQSIVEQNNEIISVSELNNAAKRLLEHNFSNVSVLGEVSNLSQPSSGHIYFSLKDESGSIRCAMFRNANSRLKFSPKNGDKCILTGQVSIYAARGDYQLIAKSMRLAGAGDLMQQFEMLKNKLDTEGLFDLTKKMPFPRFPKHICIVTAAFQDILSSLKRRCPFANISISEAVVQGDSASKTIISALKRIQKFNVSNNDKVDAVIITRGGGSIEDLWCFNNEDLARAIYNFEIPIISGVGHEIDFTITDFVADMRAPTPTAAAEIITEDYFRLSDILNNLQDEFISRHGKLIEKKKRTLELLKANLKNPVSILREKIQKIDNLELQMKRSLKSSVYKSAQDLKFLTKVLQERNPSDLIKKLLEKTNSHYQTLLVNMKNVSVSKKYRVDQVQKNLQILNPLAILDRGYSIIHNKDGEAVKTSSNVKLGEEVLARFGKGSAKLKIQEIEDD